jgi:tetratricopeptide (TPR) repeat protein
MIYIYTASQNKNQILSIIQTQPRMDELVIIKDFMEEKPINSGNALIINANGISFPLDWYNVNPPYLLPEFVMVDDEILLGMIYHKLGNHQVAKNLLANQGALWSELDNMMKLQNSVEVNPDTLTVETYQYFDDYRLMHNHAIVRHYSMEWTDDVKSKIQYYYNAAIDSAPNDEFMAFSAKHYISFLMDLQDYTLAEKIINDTLQRSISTDAKIEMEYLLCQIWMTRLTVPYDINLMESIKDKLWNVLTWYEKAGRTTELGLLLEDASHIASISDSFAESLGYITRAIKIYNDEELDDLYYNAQYKRGQLLYTWATNGQTQFFIPSTESFQQALKYFTKEDYPEIFADIQHMLGVIYSEIPDEVKKKSIWAAVSHSAFLEALSIFNKSTMPYQYAMVCNSLGNALTKYPTAIHSDNFEKSLFYYNEALEIRNATYFPFERSLTLLNYLEAAWHADNSSNELNPDRFHDMMTKSEEVIAIKASQEFVADALDHQNRLSKLREILEEK